MKYKYIILIFHLIVKKLVNKNILIFLLLALKIVFFFPNKNKQLFYLSFFKFKNILP